MYLMKMKFLIDKGTVSFHWGKFDTFCIYND